MIDDIYFEQIALAHYETRTRNHPVDSLDSSFNAISWNASFVEAIVDVIGTILAGRTHGHVGFDYERVFTFQGSFVVGPAAFPNARMISVV